MFTDYRFLPVEEHEPFEIEDDFDEETLLEHYQKKSLEKVRTNLLIAS